ncbi:hypothetical protein [Picosynechococcus sp. PCC 8807]|uniref:hypothetical protein n=1 Tax=Picosynechococcus sp. PCC 8807 TaxID=195248 RepID=UPI000810E341|nr:hypothetical protein [Picosynechococcus sp. PCC 8807]ANV90781.1 hypothetical protein AWQ24_09130 [Picosynechococcus sp. PCC 8807]
MSINQPPNFDYIHQKALSLIANSDFYDFCAVQYAQGKASADDLGDALEKYQDDCADLILACLEISEDVLLVRTEDRIYALELNPYSVTVRVQEARMLGGVEWISKL